MSPDPGRARSPFVCMACGAGTSTLFLPDCADLYLGCPLRVDYHTCSGCGLVQQSPLPDDIGMLYANYPVHTPKSALYSAIRRVLMSGVYLPPDRLGLGSGLLLDYGCGDGWYLQWCREQGLNVIGFEHDAAHASALSRRLQVDVLSDPDALLASYAGRVDLITLHFVVEHLAEPAKVFRLLGALLRPGGVVRYVVPNIRSWEFRLFGRRWHSLDAPRHLMFPGERHAQLFAQAAGLAFERSAGVPFPNGFGGSVPTALLGRFHVLGMFAVMPLALVLTRLFPAGNKAFWLRLPAQAGA